MMSVADDENVDIVASAEIMYAGHNVVSLLSLAVNGNLILVADGFCQHFGASVSHGEYGVVRYILNHGYRGKTAQHVVSGHTAGSIHHAGFNGVKQIHLSPGLSDHVGREVQNGTIILGKISCCKYSNHSLILARRAESSKNKMIKSMLKP